MDTSKRLTSVPESPIRKLAEYAAEAKKQGIRVYHLNIGDPDIRTPQPMLEVLRNWKLDPVRYGQSQGEPELLASLKQYYHGLGFDFIEENNIQVTTGGSEAISMALFATCEADDEVLVFEPFYANYNSYAVTNGIKLVPILTDIRDGFHLPERRIIEDHINPKTRAILICNPNNPTGTVYTKEEIEMLMTIAEKHNLFLLSDEVYREFVFDGKKQTSLMEYMANANRLPRAAEGGPRNDDLLSGSSLSFRGSASWRRRGNLAVSDNIIVLDSLSKRYSLCGARVGCLISLNKEIMAGALRMAQGRLSSGLVDQIMAAKLTEVPDDYIRKLQSEYQARRDVVYGELKKIPGVTVPYPEGAFYMIVKLPVADAEKFCKWLLTDFRDRNETIMLAPAAGFYATPGKGIDEARIAYVLGQKELKRAMEILGKALKVYNGDNVRPIPSWL